MSKLPDGLVKPPGYDDMMRRIELAKQIHDYGRAQCTCDCPVHPRLITANSLSNTVVIR